MIMTYCGGNVSDKEVEKELLRKKKGCNCPHCQARREYLGIKDDDPK
jgi:DNA-directed RNA polymerase subunit RPC12/RpoP